LFPGTLELKPYQLTGLNWLLCLHHANYNCILADDMGLGKTIQAIGFLTYLQQNKNVPGPHLIVVPASTYQNWQNEIQLWNPTLFDGLVAYRGTIKEKDEMRSKNRSKITIVLTTYNMFERDSGKDDRTWLRKFKFKSLICDEGKYKYKKQKERALHRVYGKALVDFNFYSFSLPSNLFCCLFHVSPLILKTPKTSLLIFFDVINIFWTL